MPYVWQHNASGHLIVLDTKFTAKILVSGQWGNLRINRDHLFQIYAYLKSQEHKSESHKSSTGVLLYPTVAYALTEAVTIQGHHIRWETVDLAQPWQDIEDELLAIPTEIVSQVEECA